MREIIIHIVTVLVVLFVVLNIAAGLIWVERRLLALWQDRYGPNRVGPFGLLQVAADTIKLFFKEDWVPPFAGKWVFILAPGIVMLTVLMSFAVLTFAPGIAIADLNIGLLFVLAMSSLGVYSVVLGGWASDNKYALLGGLRAAAQMLSYEVFMGLSLMGVVLMAGSFSMSAIVEAQRKMWFVIPQFLGFVLFLFFGGWLGPVLPPIVWFLIKMFFFIGFFILLRAALPRPRFDQLMDWGWKLMLPLALANLLVTGAIVLAVR